MPQPPETGAPEKYKKDGQAVCWPGPLRLMAKDSDSVHDAAVQQLPRPTLQRPPQLGTVRALGAHAPGPAVRAAEPTRRPSMFAHEPTLGTVAPEPPMS